MRGGMIAPILMIMMVLRQALPVNAVTMNMVVAPVDVVSLFSTVKMITVPMMAGEKEDAAIIGN